QELKNPRTPASRRLKNSMNEHAGQAVGLPPAAFAVPAERAPENDRLRAQPGANQAAPVSPLRTPPIQAPPAPPEASATPPQAPPSPCSTPHARPEQQAVHRAGNPHKT